MTREKVIEILKKETIGCSLNVQKALDIAINILERLACEDIICRQEALDLACDMYYDGMYIEAVDVRDIKDLPNPIESFYNKS